MWYNHKKRNGHDLAPDLAIEGDLTLAGGGGLSSLRHAMGITVVVIRPREAQPPRPARPFRAPLRM